MLRTNTLTTSKAKHFLDTVPFYKVLPPTFKRSPPPPYVVVEMNQFGAVLRRFSQEKRNLPKQPPPTLYITLVFYDLSLGAATTPYW